MVLRSAPAIASSPLFVCRYRLVRASTRGPCLQWTLLQRWALPEDGGTDTQVCRAGSHRLL